MQWKERRVEEAGKAPSRGRQFKTNLKHKTIQETLSETVYKNRDKDSARKVKAHRSKESGRSDVEVIDEGLVSPFR